MERHYFKELDSLKNNIIKMASLVDSQTENAFKALELGDESYCKGIKGKEKEVDAYDNLIQAQTENLLALFQPVATDLRFVIAAIMVNNQLERCGDIAVNIAQRVKKTIDSRDLIVNSKILEMGKSSQLMLKDAIDSYINQNIELANSVLERDNLVDALNKSLFSYLVDTMKNNFENIEACAHLLILVKHIERLADHATNIAENVVFLVNGKIIAHQHKLNDK
jgi:phosphate transport system protein